jgi:hypothetical protein
MATYSLTLRENLGRKLTINEIDDNFKYLDEKRQATSITYNELLDLANSDNLKVGTFYLITDFQMAHYIQYSGSGPGDEEIHLGEIEPMLVLSDSVNSISTNIISTVYPQDRITYGFTFSDREWDAVLGQSTGVITSREDTLLKLKRDFDWRNIIFRRWETISGGGTYSSILNTGFDYQDFSPFAPDSFDCYIGSPLYFGPGLGTGYWLDNTIGKQSTSQMNIKLAYGNNIEGAFDTNGKIEYFIGNNVSEDVIYNSVDYIIGNNVKRIDTNTGENIGSNDGADLIIFNNRCGSIGGNEFSGIIEKNNVFFIQGNTSTELNCRIWENFGIELQDNTNFVEIDGNKFNFLKGNDFGGNSFKTSVLNSFSDNVVDANIQNNNFLTSIYGKTFTPTAGMQSTNPSITLYDTIDGDVEQVLSGGTFSFIPF